MTTQELRAQEIIKQSGLNYKIQYNTGKLVYNLGRRLIEIKLTDFYTSVNEIGTEGTIERLAQIIGSAPLRRVHN